MIVGHDYRMLLTSAILLWTFLFPLGILSDFILHNSLPASSSCYNGYYSIFSSFISPLKAFLFLLLVLELSKQAFYVLLNMLQKPFFIFSIFPRWWLFFITKWQVVQLARCFFSGSTGLPRSETLGKFVHLEIMLMCFNQLR